MRVALHAYNTPGDVDHFLKTLSGAL
jgi:selenocysteine lyase/cysteine desulfurase